MKIENQYIIPFKGLKEGIHEFSFSLSGEFFEKYEKLDVSGGDVIALVKLRKNSNFLELEIDMKGEIGVPCDRCLEYFDMPVNYTGHLIVRYSETEKEPDDEVIFIHPEESLLDLTHFFYECIFLSIPIRKVHPDQADGTTGCNMEMLKYLREHLIE